MAAPHSNIAYPVVDCRFRKSLARADHSFPETVGFGMALECMLHREDKRPIKLDIELVVIPFSIRIIDGYICRNFRWWRVRVGIRSITPKDAKVRGSTESKEKMLHRLLDTGGVG